MRCNIFPRFAFCCVMKYPIHLYIVLLTTFAAFGQQGGTITLEWQDSHTVSVNETDYKVPIFQEEYARFDYAKMQLVFSLRKQVQGAANPSSLAVTNIVYEDISPAMLGSIKASGVPAALDARLLPGKARDLYFATLQLNPIIREGQSFKRVKSFTYSFALGGNALSLKSGLDTNIITNSVLANGEFYRFYVEKSGVYKITRSFLQQLGMDTNVDPRRIKIYGNGGRMLPLRNSDPYPDDLAENAIKVVGEQDGQFDSSDYILFYAEGMDNWSAENGTHNNLYADRSYYYVTAYGGNGKRINAVPEPAGVPDVTTSEFDEYVFHEEDIINIARLGRKFHGEAFNVDKVQEFDFDVPDIVPGPASITVSAAAISVASSSLSVKVNGQEVGSVNIGPPPTNYEANDGAVIGTFNASSDNITVTLDYNNNGVPTANAWLDFIVIKCRRSLKGGNGQFRFRYNDAANNTGVIQYQFSSATGISEVWDITDIYNTARVAENSEASFSFKANMGEVRQYVTVAPANYFMPLKE